MTPLKGSSPSQEGGKESKVVVAVRSRPLFEKERAKNAANCLRFIPGGQQVVLGQDRAFTYDHAFDDRTTQQHIFDTCVRGLIDGLFDGYNATVFAYGQTGTGKTHTMGSGMNTSENRGIIPRVIETLFQRIQEQPAAGKATTFDPVCSRACHSTSDSLGDTHPRVPRPAADPIPFLHVAC